MTEKTEPANPLPETQAGDRPPENSRPTAPPTSESVLQNIRRNIQEGLQTGRSGIQSGYRDAVRNLDEGYESARTSIKSGLNDARVNIVSGLESARQGINHGITKAQESLAVDSERHPPPLVVNTRPAELIDEKAQVQEGVMASDRTVPPPYEETQREQEGESIEEMTRRLERGVQARGLLSRNPPQQMQRGGVGGAQAGDRIRWDTV